MIPILDAQQLKQADAETIRREPIASIDLMERAAERCTELLLRDDPHVKAWVVLAGMGNNGGDGAAMARMLKEQGKEVRLIVIRYREQPSPDLAANIERARQVGVPVEMLEKEGELPAFKPHERVVDALFGMGLTRPLEGWLKHIVQALNERPNEVVAIDLPSGLFADDNQENDREAIVRADRTLTIGLPKLALLLAGNGRYSGEWQWVPIGLDREFIAQQKPQAQVLEAQDVVPLLPPRRRTAHKGDHGHAWLLAGGPGKMGAAIMAAMACSRSGCGLLTTHVPAGRDVLLHAALPEAMTSLDDEPVLSGLPKFGRVDAIGVGPGIGVDERTARMLKHLIQDAPAPLVIDADALNILAENPTWLSFLPAGTILTPHPGEFDRLAGRSTADLERLGKAKEMAQRHSVIMVLKGAYTALCVPDGRVYFNTTGNPGMAKGGSGDVLTGIITALRAQGMNALHAALLGVFIQGWAGDIAAREHGMDGMLATDLIGALPKAWKQLRALVP